MTENESHAQRRYRSKRAFDLTVLALSHILLLPIWLVLWTVIPILIFLADRGPIFYAQERIGKNGRIFTILKFRTMAPDADRNGPSWTVPGDPRVTRLGKLLRRTALDELPEVLSIWRGDMSLVGPRALDVEEEKRLEQQITGFEQRLRGLPGLTGMAQIYNRSDNSEEKLRYDLEYLKNMNLWLDLRLVILSVWFTVSGRWDGRAGKPTPGGTDSEAFSTSDRQS